jgi:hypothetical protein
LGDAIQFVRYAPLVKERGARVLFECHPKLRTFLSGVAGVDRLVADAGEERFDYQVSLVSLPGIFGTTPATIPAPAAYLAADPARVAHWREKLRPLAGFKVGLNWQGNANFGGDYYRSAPLAKFAPLAEVPGVTLCSLQWGPGAKQLADVAGRFPVVDLGTPLDTESDAFVNTAAVIRNLDLVITTDTAVAHLAGALGVPVWVALQLSADWRYLEDRSDCAWYPSMRLFRQTRLGAWDDVFRAMVGPLQSLAAQPRIDGLTP